MAELCAAAGNESHIEEAWAQGLNVYQATIQDLLRVALSLAGEDSRPAFLRALGEQINQGVQPSLRTTGAKLVSRI